MIQHAVSDPKPTAENPETDDPAPTVSLAQISWSVTTLVFVGGGIALLFREDYGYAIVALVIAVGAALNLLP